MKCDKMKVYIYTSDGEEDRCLTMYEVDDGSNWLTEMCKERLSSEIVEIDEESVCMLDLMIDDGFDVNNIEHLNSWIQDMNCEGTFDVFREVGNKIEYYNVW